MTNEFLIGSRHIGDRSVLSAGGGRQADRKRRRSGVGGGENKDEWLTGRVARGQPLIMIDRWGQDQRVSHAPRRSKVKLAQLS